MGKLFSSVYNGIMRFGSFWILVATVLYAGQSEEEALFLRRIADFWQEGEYQIAKNQMEEFIVQYPESSFSEPLCAALGDLALREKNYSGALNYYSRIQSSDVAERVFLSRMQCLYEMQWFATLAKECEAYLEKKANLHATYFLAIALYHQCLNATKEPKTLVELAMRAKPYFETLFQSELSDEVAQGLAHLCYILKDFSQASQIYLKLAKKDPNAEEEMLFQVALIQSEYDKTAAVQTFEQIISLKQKRAKDAVYNRLVLLFDLGQYEAVKQIQLEDLPSDKMGLAHLFLGRSLLHLKDYEKAVAELKIYIKETNDASDTFRAALVSLLDAAYNCNDLKALNQAIEKMMAIYPQDIELPKAYFSRAQVLKKRKEIPQARQQFEQLLTQFSQFQQKPQAIFELIQLDFQEQNWNSCKQRAKNFLSLFSEHDLATFVWRYFISSSANQAIQNPELKEQLISDLETFLKQDLPEKGEWQFLLAKTEFELGHYEKAIEELKNLNTPNSILLLAFCYRDGQGDQKQFCELAESALSKSANLVDEGTLRLALFNAYLYRAQEDFVNFDSASQSIIDSHFEHHSQLEKGEKQNRLGGLGDPKNASFLGNGVGAASQNLQKLTERGITLSNLAKAAEHLYGAFEAKADITNENLYWLACFYANVPSAQKVVNLLESIKNEPLPEFMMCQLAKAYATLGRFDDEIALIESFQTRGNEAQLLLAEGYAHKGSIEKAIKLFDGIVASTSTLRSYEAASACLQGAKLKLMGQNPDFEAIAKQLKDLKIQKTLMNEPVHLEAALEYVDLQAKDDLEKKIFLLKKTKADFESTDDLLSKDYHEARLKISEKNQIYQHYMRLIDAEILALEKDVKAKTMLLELIKEKETFAYQALLKRVHMLLKIFE